MSFMSSCCKYCINVEESRSRKSKGALQLFMDIVLYPEKQESARHMPVNHSQFCVIAIKDVKPEGSGDEAEVSWWSG